MDDLYGDRAADYADKADSSVWNALYERPALRSLLPPVAGLRVLDAACSAGSNARWLLDAGADVVAVDASRPLLSLAADRLVGFGDRLRTIVADLGDGLPEVPTDSVDAIFSSLTIHYLADLHALFDTFARVLRPYGTLVFSTHHPMFDWQYLGMETYFDVGEVTDRWSLGGGEISVRFNRRTLADILNPLAQSGFAIDHIAEPGSDPEIAAADARAGELLSQRPQYLFVRAISRP